MPKATEYLAAKPVKFLFIGQSGAGKTGALTSLVKAGYDLRIYDFDIGLDALFYHVKQECPERLDSIEFMTFRDKYVAGPTGPTIRGGPRALVNSLKALEKWEDDSDPSTWGLNKVVVIDSLTHMGRAALAWAQQQNPTFKDPRLWYGPAQNVLENTLATLTSPDFNTNVIVISHVDIREGKDGIVTGNVSAVGEALGPKVPSYFNTLVLSETSGSGSAVRRKIKTMPTSLIALKNPMPGKISPDYPVETGLAEIFQKLKTGGD